MTVTRQVLLHLLNIIYITQPILNEKTVWLDVHWIYQLTIEFARTEREMPNEILIIYRNKNSRISLERGGLGQVRF